MELLILFLIFQAIFLFIFFRKKQYSYDEVANFTRIFLVGIPIALMAYFLNQISISIYAISSTIITVLIYLEYVSYSTKKDPGFTD